MRGEHTSTWRGDNSRVRGGSRSRWSTFLRPDTHLFAGEQERRRSHQLEAVCSHRRGHQEPVHDVHRQAAALEGQLEILVQRDEPADQGAPRLCRQLQPDIFKIISHIKMGHW